MGPFQEQSLAGFKNALVMLDDYSRYTAVKCLAFKSDVPEVLLQTFACCQTQLETTKFSGLTEVLNSAMPRSMVTATPL